MSFPNKDPGVLNEIGALTDGETGSGTSLRIEKKRTHQYFMDASVDSNEKQTVQSVSENTTNFQSAPVHSSDNSHAPEPLGTSNFGNKDLFSLGNENVRSERNLFFHRLQNNLFSHAKKEPSDLKARTSERSRFFRLQNNLLSRAGKEPIYLNAGTRGASISLLRNSSNTGEDSINATPLGLTYGARIGNVINSAKGKKPVSPIDNTINKVNGDCMPVGMTGNEDISVASRIPTPEKLMEVEGAEGSKAILQKTPKSYRNTFPANVRSLLSTGILEGVPVKYISWSREKTLRGVIQGYGYLCGCNDCKLSKNLSASEFERHAAVCKTRHPNNHIYFESGKTIHAVVQELKKTPLKMFCEAIQNITGSSINPKNFQLWIDYLQVAEQYHLFAKDEVAKPFSSADSFAPGQGRLNEVSVLKSNCNERP